MQYLLSAGRDFGREVKAEKAGDEDVRQLLEAAGQDLGDRRRRRPAPAQGQQQAPRNRRDESG